jgi:hypothetical protein
MKTGSMLETQSVMSIIQSIYPVLTAYNFGDATITKDGGGSFSTSTIAYKHFKQQIPRLMYLAALEIPLVTIMRLEGNQWIGSEWNTWDEALRHFMELYRQIDVKGLPPPALGLSASKTIHFHGGYFTFDSRGSITTDYFYLGLKYRDELEAMRDLFLQELTHPDKGVDQLCAQLTLKTS